MRTCSQCQRPAIVQRAGHFLCVEHNAMLQQTVDRENAADVAYFNYVKAEAEELAGLAPPGSARLEIPQPTVHTGPVHNIRVDRSVVGAINTGVVQSLNVSVEAVRLQDADGAGAIAQVAKAVQETRDLPLDRINAALEHLEFLASEAARPREERKRAVALAAAEAVQKILNLSADLAAIWTVAGQKIVSFFQ